MDSATPSNKRNTRVLIAGDRPGEWQALDQALTLAGFTVLARAASDADLEVQVRDLQPDAIIIHADSPERDTLEHLAVLHSHWPRPMVMLCGEADARSTRVAAAAGVSLYVVDRLSPAAVRSLVDMALVHFQDRQQLARELREAREALDDRRAIDDAKCLLMEHEHLGEAQAYHRLRRLAMQRGQRVADVSRALLAAARREATGTAIATTTTA